jgi:hypothetical protein
MHLVGYLYEDYHDARSLEHKVKEILNIKFNENLFCGFLVAACGHVDEEIRRET